MQGRSQKTENPLIEIQAKESHHVEEEISLSASDMGLVSNNTDEDVGSFDHAPELIISNPIPHQLKLIQQMHLPKEEVATPWRWNQLLRKGSYFSEPVNGFT